MKNVLDIERARQIDPDELMSEVEFMEEAYESLYEQLKTPPTLMNDEGEEALWEPPDSIADLSDDELEQAIWQSARIYGHYARIAESAKGLLAVAKEEVGNLAVILYKHFYPGILKTEIKSALSGDVDYKRANTLKNRLLILYSDAEGNRKDWSKLSDRLSRVVELRKDSHLPKGGNRGRRVKSPKNIKKIFGKE